MQQYHSTALLLSLAAHLGVGYVIAVSGVSGSTNTIGQLPRGVTIVSLDPGDNRLKPALTQAGRINKSAEKNTGEFAARPTETRVQSGAKNPSLLAIQEPPAPYYFHVRELTEKPRVAQDIPPDLILLVPDITTQPTILRLLINEHGRVDRVVIEDFNFPVKVEQRVVDAFSRIRFEPGKIGHIPVRSQLRIEILSESTTPHSSSGRQEEPLGETEIKP